MVCDPAVVAAFAVAVPVTRALAPEILFVVIGVPLDIGFGWRCAIERIDDALWRFVGHGPGKHAIEIEKLRVGMMPREHPAVCAVEPAVAQNKFHVLVPR